MRVFLAAAGTHRWRAAEAIDFLRSLGHKVYDWVRQPEWDLESFDKGPIAERDLLSVAKSDVLVWLVCDKMPSQGAPFEAGFAFGKGIPVVILRDSDDPIPQISIYPEWASVATVVGLPALGDLLANFKKFSNKSTPSWAAKKSRD